MNLESHVVAVNPTTDLLIVKEMVGELENYIVNEDLYRTVTVRTPSGDARLQMTGGDLLTRLYRLSRERARLSPAEQQSLDALQAESEKIIYSLKSRFQQRLVRELKARTDALKWYLDDAAQTPVEGKANYPYEIRNRQRIEESIKALGNNVPGENAAALAQVDRRLRGMGRGADFVWDESLAEVFPSQPYWYLYV
jgi:hypothetical protein